LLDQTDIIAFYFHVVCVHIRARSGDRQKVAFLFLSSLSVSIRKRPRRLLRQIVLLNLEQAPEGKRTYIKLNNKSFKKGREEIGYYGPVIFSFCHNKNVKMHVFVNTTKIARE